MGAVATGFVKFKNEGKRMSLPTAEKEYQANSPEVLFGVPSFPEEVVSGTLRIRPAQIVKLLGEEIHSLVAVLVRSPTVDEFKKQRTCLIPSYRNLVLAVSSVIVSSIPDKEQSVELAVSALDRSESAFRNRGNKKLGPELTGEVLFSLSTLKRAILLTRQLVSNAVEGDQKKRDAEL